MNSKPFKTILLAVFVAGGFTLASCDKGQRPGETNVEDSEHIEEGSLNEGYTSDDYPANDDSTTMEDHYDHADHENHSDNEAGAVHAGDGKKDNP